MKELIRQYAGTAIAVVTALVLIALVSEMSVVVEKGIPKSRALCETDTAALLEESMKNIILGILGCMVAVYTIVSCLSIYSISTRKNEMENCISQVLKYHLNRYYATGVSDTEVEAFIRQEIRQQLHTASRVSIDVKSCDMVSGVISVRVTEDFVLPGGFHKSIACDKTILVETEVIEEETETEEIWPQEEEV